VHERTQALLELERFEQEHPRSAELSRRARGSLLAGVPMHWMVRWPGAYPVFAADAQGARFRDVDGKEYVDFCLGDTGAMTGHSPEPVVRAVAEQAARGITLMLPSEEALWVGEELTRRFGPPRWQFALTATDANRFAIRLARLITRRPKVLVFDWCYHGTVDETFATLQDGDVVAREGNLGPPVPLDETTCVVEWSLTCSRSARRSAAAFPLPRTASARRWRRVSRRRSTGMSPTSGAWAGRWRRTCSRSAVRATLEYVLTDDAFAGMIALGERFERGVQRAIDEHGLPWQVTRLGCHVEYLFRPGAPRHRQRRGGRRRPRARSPDPPLRAQPRDPADAVSQHGADVARDDG
jgi:glutamate-1-semialdehyde aminotransferase